MDRGPFCPVLICVKLVGSVEALASAVQYRISLLDQWLEKRLGVRIGRKREPDLRQPRRHQRRQRAIADLVNGREPHQHFVADLIQRPGDPFDGVAA